MSDRLEIRLDDSSVGPLRDWASLWGDLLHAEMALRARSQVPGTAANLFVRRALWESAVIAYGRTAMSGRRQQQIRELIKQLGGDAQKTHDDIMQWRNKHVAHRVDDSREQTEARAIVESGRIQAIRVRVSPVLGPEEEEDDLAIRAERHAKALRDLAWEQRIVPAEQDAIAANGQRVESLIATRRAPEDADDGRFAVDIDPSGGDSGDGSKAPS